MENHYTTQDHPRPNNTQNVAANIAPHSAQLASEELSNISFETSSSSNPTTDYSTRDSSSESDFERFGLEELAEADSRRLSEFGSRLANEVLNQVVAGEQGNNNSDLSTPNNEPISPLSNFMDERDLFVVPEAGNTEVEILPQPTNPAVSLHSPSYQQQDEIENHSFHDLESKLEEEEADLLGFSSSPQPPIAEVQETHSKPEDYDELISFGNPELDAPVQAPAVEQEEKDKEHLYMEHFSSSSPTIQEEEAYSHNSDVGQDPLSHLSSETVHQLQPEKTPSILESSSVTGMRDLSDEESTYDRKGPLTIPASAMTHQPPTDNLPTNFFKQSNEVLDKDEIAAKAHNWLEPRPPTPPKELSEPEEEKPSVVDLGPPPHPHHHSPHGSSDKGLQSILKKTGPWIDFQHVDPKVLEIIYWRDAKRSGGVLAVLLVALFLFAKCSLLSLVAYTSLAALAGTIGFRVFKLAEGQIKKTDGSNPFQSYLEQEISVPQERLHSQVDVLVEHGQTLVKQLRHLFLVENLMDSVKFGMLLYTLTYVGSWFSGISIVLIFILALFSVPKFYEVYKEPVDYYLGIAKENIEKVQHQVTDKLPLLKKVTEGEKKEQ